MAGRQYGTIKKLAKGKWQVRTTAGYGRDGKQLTKSETVFGEKAKAEKARQALVYTYHPAYQQKAVSGWTVKKALDEYRAANAQVWTANGRATRAAHSKRLKVLHKAPLLALTVKDVEQFRNWLLKSHEPSYVRSIIGTLSSCLAWSVKHGQVAQNVADGIKVPMSTKKATAPASSDVKAFLNGIKEIEPQFYAAFRLAAVTGARRQEVLGLQWSDVDGNKLTFRRTVSADRTVRDSLKASAIKVLSVDPETIEALEAARADDLWVFGSDGQPRCAPTG